jgi:hypothetical protein
MGARGLKLHYHFDSLQTAGRAPNGARGLKLRGAGLGHLVFRVAPRIGRVD